MVWVRLDRGVATSDWLIQFSEAMVYNLDAIASNHKPIRLTTSSVVVVKRRKRKQFRFESMWLLDEGCGGTVEAAWKETRAVSSLQGFTEKLAWCSSKLQHGNRNSFGGVRVELAKKQALLQEY